MFTGAFTLGFIGQDHFMDGGAARDGRIEYGHGLLPFFISLLL